MKNHIILSGNGTSGYLGLLFVSFLLFFSNCASNKLIDSIGLYNGVSEESKFILDKSIPLSEQAQLLYSGDIYIASSNKKSIDWGVFNWGPNNQLVRNTKKSPFIVYLSAGRHQLFYFINKPNNLQKFGSSYMSGGVSNNWEGDLYTGNFKAGHIYHLSTKTYINDSGVVTKVKLIINDITSSIKGK